MGPKVRNINAKNWRRIMPNCHIRKMLTTSAIIRVPQTAQRASRPVDCSVLPSVVNLRSSFPFLLLVIQGTWLIIPNVVNIFLMGQFGIIPLQFLALIFDVRTLPKKKAINSQIETNCRKRKTNLKKKRNSNNNSENKTSKNFLRKVK